MIGIDFGASFLDVAVLIEGKLERTYSISQGHYSKAFLENIVANELHLQSQQKPSLKEKSSGIIAVEKENPHLLELKRRWKIRTVGEMAAIANGAGFLTKKKEFVVLNIGTGTPIVYVKGRKHEHIAGTGIGGGTLEGLGKLLLNARVTELEGWANQGSNSLDLSVEEVMGRKVGRVPVEATASNFGKAAKAERSRREDLAKSLLNMVGEVLGVMGALAARGCNCRDVVFTGRVADENRMVRERIANTLKLFKGKAIFPKDAKYCTAIGAAVMGKTH